MLRPALDTYFPESSGVRIISEPGRFFVASAFTLAVNVIAKRAVPRDNSSYEKGKFLKFSNAYCNLWCQKLCLIYYLQLNMLFITDDTTTADDEPHFMYYVNDGVYGSFNCLLYDHAEVYFELLEVRQIRRCLRSRSLHSLVFSV